jgi:predicted nucleic acid-binding protein
MDTNILVYAHEKEDDQKQARSQKLVLDAIQSGNGVISPQVLSEFYVTVTRKIAEPLGAEVARKELSLLSILSTVDEDATLVLRAVDLMNQWKTSFWDAKILAAAERASCSVLYSEDLSHEQHFGSVQVLNPYK